MLKIEIATQAPAPKPGQITAQIEIEGRPLANPATLSSHPGAGDLARRRKLGAIKRPYLTASEVQLAYLPGASATHFSDTEKVKILAADAFALAEERKADSLVFILDAASADDAANVAEGLALYAYRFSKYKQNGNEKKTLPAIKFIVSSDAKSEVRRLVDERLRLAESVNHARDLINEPGSVCTPTMIEQEARKVAKRGGLGIAVLDEKQLRKEGYEGLLAVGRGGCCPPRMIVLSYDPKGMKPPKKSATGKPAKAAKSGIHLGLLGKGVTFDTGGVSIKPAAKMWEMKGDMSGAAAVLYGMEAIAASKPNVRVTGIIVTAQNYVDFNALLPGDLIRARNGKTIHVDNTDAEGRLILTDGLWRAGEEGVTHLVDFATLTGAIVRALGTSLSGAFGNDDFVDRVVEIAEAAGEPAWKMPLVTEYIELLKTDVADINNIGSKPEGSAIQAAIFLKEFLPDNIHWTHMDIAGTFLVNSRWKYYRPGATGVMVRTIENLAESMAVHG